MAGDSTRVSLHVGKALTNIIARTYPTLRDTVLEAVQNAIDANARHIWVRWDERRRVLQVQDNGDGVGRNVMNVRLQQICSSGKGEDDLGQFGIGVMAPVDKGAEYTFTSAPRVPATGDDNSYHRWTFRLRDIEGSQELAVPCSRLSQLRFDADHAPNSSDGIVPWRTEVRVEGVIGDAVRSRLDLDDLKYQIQQRFSSAMRKKDVTVTFIRVVRVGKSDDQQATSFGALDFMGDPLPRWQLRHPAAGAVAVQLYLRRVRSGRQQQRIEVGEQKRDYRITLAQFLASAGSLLSQGVRDAFGSGILEGEVTAENIRITPNRKGVEQDDALVGLCEALETWYRKVGGQIVADVRSSRDHERWQEIGVQVLRGVDEMLRDPAFADWREAVKGFRSGTVGIGHAEPTPRSVVGKQVQPSVRVHRSNGPGSHSRGDGSGEGTNPPNERERDMPITVGGPRGQARTVVKRSSFGIQVTFDVMPGSTDLWTLNSRTGEISVNVRHPNWARCERSDRELEDLLRRIVEHALAWNATPDDWKPQVLLGLSEAMRGYMFLRAAALATRARRSQQSGEERKPKRAEPKKKAVA